MSKGQTEQIEVITDSKDHSAVSLSRPISQDLPYEVCVSELFDHYNEGKIAEVKASLENSEIYTRYPNIINEVNKNNITLLGLAAKDGNCEFIEYLLKRPNIDTNKGVLNPLYPDYQLTPLDIAMQYNQVETGALLVKNGVTLKIDEGGEPIMRISSEPIKDFLDNIEEHMESLCKRTETYYRILELSKLSRKEENQFHGLKVNRYEDAHINAYNEIGNAIDKALLSQGKIIELISQNKDVERVINGNKQHLMHIAAKEGMSEVVEHLTELLPQLLNIADVGGFYPLDYALLHQHQDCVTTLIDRGAKLSRLASWYLEADKDSDVYKCCEQFMIILLEASKNSSADWLRPHNQVLEMLQNEVTKLNLDDNYTSIAGDLSDHEDIG